MIGGLSVAAWEWPGGCRPGRRCARPAAGWVRRRRGAVRTSRGSARHAGDDRPWLGGGGVASTEVTSTCPTPDNEPNWSPPHRPGTDTIARPGRSPRGCGHLRPWPFSYGFFTTARQTAAELPFRVTASLKLPVLRCLPDDSDLSVITPKAPAPQQRSARHGDWPQKARDPRPCRGIPDRQPRQRRVLPVDHHHHRLGRSA
jgi:hypothetical protein